MLPGKPGLGRRRLQWSVARKDSKKEEAHGDDRLNRTRGLRPCPAEWHMFETGMFRLTTVPTRWINHPCTGPLRNAAWGGMASSTDPEAAAGLLLGYAGVESRETPPSVADSPATEVIKMWINYLQQGYPVPDGETVIRILQAAVQLQVPRSMYSASANQGFKLIMDQPFGKKFPHLLDDANGTLSEEEAIWTQCKTKMTHIVVRLVNSQGEPVSGSTVQQGGLELRLTLHGENNESLTDESNPRYKTTQEGLFLGRARAKFEPGTILMETRHEFRFQVMLLSSDIGGARMFVKVAPARPDLSLDDNLVARSHSFISRARMPDESYFSNKRPCPSVPGESNKRPCLSPTSGSVADGALALVNVSSTGNAVEMPGEIAHERLCLSSSSNSSAGALALASLGIGIDQRSCPSPSSDCATDVPGREVSSNV